MLLYANSGGVPRGMRVHGADHGRDGGLLVVAGRRVRHVHAQEYNRLVEHLHRTGALYTMLYHTLDHAYAMHATALCCAVLLHTSGR